MAKYENVFSPTRIGNVKLKNRIELAPAVPCLATSDGFVTREMVEYYKTLARGGAAIVTIGDSVVDFEYAKEHEHQLNLGNDRVVAGLSNVVEAIHRYGAKTSIEINHGGRFSSPRLTGKYPIAPSPLPAETELMWLRLQGKRIDYKVMEMTQDQINMVIEHFAEACFRCLQAGFEMVMIHGAHGQLLAQFVSPYTNKRTDHYGGNFENRARFVIELLDAVRARVGNQLAIEYRVSAEEFVPEGMKLEDTIKFVKMIEDKIDLLHVSAGLITDPPILPRMIQPTYLPRGLNVQYAARLKEEVDTPIAVVGSIDLEMADKLVGENACDIVAMARPILADTSYVNKYRTGMVGQVRPCTRCNFCIQRVAQFLPIRCAVNPILGREMEYPSIRPADKRKKVVVVGGGPSGMQAAQTAASRGHEVTLCEMEKELGGALRFAAAPPFKTDLKKYLEWLTDTVLHTRGIEVRLSTEATPEMVKEESPDAVIVSVGGEPIIPNIPGVKKPNVVWAGDVLVAGARLSHAHEKVAIAGAGLTGCETALYLAQQGKKVALIDKLSQSEIAQDTPFINRIALLDLLHQHGVEFRTEVCIDQITDSGIMVIDRQWNRFEISADTIVLALGVKPKSNVAESFQGLASEVYAIGDCVRSGKLSDAIHQAFNIAVEL